MVSIIDPDRNSTILENEELWSQRVIDEYLQIIQGGGNEPEPDDEEPS